MLEKYSLCRCYKVWCVSPNYFSLIPLYKKVGAPFYQPLKYPCAPHPCSSEKVSAPFPFAPARTKIIFAGSLTRIFLICKTSLSVIVLFAKLNFIFNRTTCSLIFIAAVYTPLLYLLIFSEGSPFCELNLLCRLITRVIFSFEFAIVLKECVYQQQNK